MNNVLLFPKSKNAKIQEAVDKFGYESAEIALNKFKVLIDEGCDEAFAFVGTIYEFGAKNVNHDYNKAKFYYEQSIERFGAVEAYLGLIRIYYYGLGVEKNCCQALEFCKILVEDKNDAYANYFIGKMYMEGCCVDKDIVMAKYHFSESWKSKYVFGLTQIAIIEKNSGNYVKSLYLRLKAGLITFMIARKNINDPRIRVM